MKNTDADVEQLAAKLETREKRWGLLTTAIVVILVFAGLTIAYLTTRQAQDLSETKGELAQSETKLELKQEADVHLQTAFREYEAGHHEVALEATKAALRLDPASPVARELKTSVEKKLPRVPDAIRRLKDAVRRDPRNPEARLDLIHAYSIRGDISAVISQVEQGLEHNPEIKTFIMRDPRFERIRETPEVKRLLDRN